MKFAKLWVLLLPLGLLAVVVFLFIAEG